MSYRVLTIDPGTHSTGYCVWHVSQSTYKHNKPVEWGLLKSHSTSWLKNCEQVWRQIEEVHTRHMPKRIISEYPEYWQGTAGAAAREGGAFFKLAFFVGGIYNKFLEYGPVDIVTPSQWKGQMDKDLVRRRMKKKLPDMADILEKMDHNVLEAIAIGYSQLIEVHEK